MDIRGRGSDGAGRGACRCFVGPDTRRYDKRGQVRRRATMPRRQRSPNVVLIISDEQRADTMPGVRTADVSTPHLEWLAAQGTLFRTAYCVTPIARQRGLRSCPACIHTRRAWVPTTRKVPSRTSCTYHPMCAFWPITCSRWATPAPIPASGISVPAVIGGLSRFRHPRRYYDVDGPEQNDILRFAARVGVTLGGKKAGHDADPARFCARTRVGSSLLPLAFHPSLLNARAAARFIHRMAADERPFCLVYSCHEPHPEFVSRARSTGCTNRPTCRYRRPATTMWGRACCGTAPTGS